MYRDWAGRDPGEIRPASDATGPIEAERARPRALATASGP